MKKATLFSVALMMLTTACGTYYSTRDTNATNDPTWQVQEKYDKIVENYDAGYTGPPIFDKNGKLVVFEGPGVDRKTALDYVNRDNKPH